MKIIKIAALKTNWIWIIYNHMNECIIIDPGESTKLLKIIKMLQLTIKSILITHYHLDHTAGIHKILYHFPKAIIFGPQHTSHINIKQTIIPIGSEDNLKLLNKKIEILHIPGHTSNHVGFYLNPWLFCGDTVFPMGCGKTPIELVTLMYKSILKIKKLPENTLICSGHDYIFNNINFALSILPFNDAIINHRNKIIKLYKKNQPIQPPTLRSELKVNPFFQCNQAYIKKALNIPNNIKEEWKIFQKLRQKKDLYN